MGVTVAIDGPAAAGKGTIARAVAERFGLAYLDTGLLYRAVGKKAVDQGRGVLDEGMAIIAARELTEADLACEGLRGAVAARIASKVAAIPEVRKALIEFQRRFAAREPGAVLDGRDIGTVICPDATVKLFVTASLEARAARRHAELSAVDAAPSLERVRKDLEARDVRDTARAAAPLARAPDAHLLDTTELSIEAAVARASEIIEQSLSRAQA